MKNNLKISSFLSGKNSMKIIIFIGLFGILLIACSEYIKPKSIKEKVNSSSYSTVLEERISAIVTAITGEDKPGVMITLESGVQNIYATESKEKKSSDSGEREENEKEEKYIIIKNSQGNQEALLVTEIQPMVKGVVIVSKFSQNSVAKENIINSVKTVLGIASNKVYVVNKKG